MAFNPGVTLVGLLDRLPKARLLFRQAGFEVQEGLDPGQPRLAFQG